MRLKKCVLSFLRKLVRVEMSLMSDGRAFQAMQYSFINRLDITQADKQRDRQTDQVTKRVTKGRFRFCLRFVHTGARDAVQHRIRCEN